MKNQTTAGDPRGTTDKLKEKVGDATEQVQETASHLASEARQKGEHLIDEGREKVHELGERAEEMARSRADQEKQRVTTGIRVVADALRRGGDGLTGDRAQYRPLLNTAADRVEGLTTYLESHDVDDLTNDMRRFARDHTPLFLGGAFALGFAGARFLKSSSDQAARARAADMRMDTGYGREDRFDRMLPDTDTMSTQADTTRMQTDSLRTQDSLRTETDTLRTESRPGSTSYEDGGSVGGSSYE